LIAAADEQNIESLVRLLGCFNCKLRLGLHWILESQLLRAGQLDRPQVEVLPVLLALELGGHV
jgi:hypothetical protein